MLGFMLIWGRTLNDYIDFVSTYAHQSIPRNPSDGIRTKKKGCGQRLLPEEASTVATSHEKIDRSTCKKRHHVSS